VSSPVTLAIREWAERGWPGAQVTGCTVRPLDGGAVADRVDQVTLHLSSGQGRLERALGQLPS